MRILLASLFLAGCAYRAEVIYSPLPIADVPVAGAVRLAITDQRAEPNGKPQNVGNVRGGYGNPFPVRADGPERVLLWTQYATVDALRHVGVAVAPNAPLVVNATVRRFWVDGYMMSYAADVELEYTLSDPAGRLLWRGVARGKGAGAPPIFASVGGIAEFVSGLLKEALVNAAADAYNQFRLPAFRALVPFAGGSGS